MKSTTERDRLVERLKRSAQTNARVTDLLRKAYHELPDGEVRDEVRVYLLCHTAEGTGSPA